jgi:hypothetical protein
MKKILRKWLGVEKELNEAQEKLKKLEEDAGPQEKTEKELATEAKKPYIKVLNLDLDENDPSYGSVELDWNEYFIMQLRQQGYPGKEDEVVVDLWFQSICRNILAETYEQELAAQGDNVRYINRRDLGDGKTEVS